MSEHEQHPQDEPGQTAPEDLPVDEDEGLAIPGSEEQARAVPVSDEVHEKAAEVSRDETVVGNTDMGGTGGGTRFFGAGAPDAPSS